METDTKAAEGTNVPKGGGSVDCHVRSYPDWVCASCGSKYGRRTSDRELISCWHTGICGVCGIEASVTEPRDFGHLRAGWEFHSANVKLTDGYRRENE